MTRHAIGGPPVPTTIVFGTDGWRARVAEDFTYQNVRRCAEGVARYVVDRGEQAKGVVVTYDRRFSSEHFAATAAEVVLAYGVPVAITRTAAPTQMASFEVVERGAAAGIVITASHNPWTDNGFKVKSPTGAAAGPDLLAVLEAVIAENGARPIPVRPLADAEAAGLVERIDPYPAYERFVRRTLDLDALRAADARILVDPMWGSGAGWIPRLLAGGRIEVVEIHGERNPWFGGVNPEPIRPNVDEALGLVARGGFDLGLLLDGDADRSGAVDERGVFVHQLQVYGLLMYYLAEHRGLRDPVVNSVNGTSMAERLGARYGIAVHETPVGFKFVGPTMIETGAMFGGEESGGYGFGMHLPERDGIYSDLLLLDLFLRERAAGRGPASRTIEHLHAIAGPSFYRRVDVHVERATYAATKARLAAELVEQAPTELAGQPVTRSVALSTKDGVKFFIEDGSWLLVRFSGIAGNAGEIDFAGARGTGGFDRTLPRLPVAAGCRLPACERGGIARHAGGSRSAADRADMCRRSRTYHCAGKYACCRHFHADHHRLSG